jgi:hypothetical protein
MKYQVQVLSFTNFTVNADSEDKAREKVINTELDWFINSHSEWDTNNRVKIDPIKIHKIKEVA